MRNSSTYQLILEEGREAGLTEGREAGLTEGREAGLTEGREQSRQMLIQLANRRLGPPKEEHKAALASISDITVLMSLADKIEAVESWDELLAFA